MQAADFPYLRHLLGMEILDAKTIQFLFKRTQHFLNDSLQNNSVLDTLHGRVVTCLFFEPSTRTRCSFEIAAQRLGAIFINPNMSSSAVVKGESLLDTIHVCEQMGTELFIIRHTENNITQFIASELNTNAAIINAGDGYNQHPTQALLDLFTISRHTSNFADLSVAIIGDILHSRVARSLIDGLKIMGTENIRLIAPSSLLPQDHDISDVNIFDSPEEGLVGCDVIMTLRIQKERMETSNIPNPEKFHKEFGLTKERLALAKPTAIVMHPGPMNRGIEIDSDVADGSQSVIAEQVTNGVAMRMAVMEALFHGKQRDDV